MRNVHSCEKYILSSMNEFIEDRMYLRSFLSFIERNVGSWAVLGGAPRSWALGHSLVRDIDIVVSGEMDKLEDEIRNWTSNFSESSVSIIGKNKHGGIRLYTKDIKIDIWSLYESTMYDDKYISQIRKNPYRWASRISCLSLDSLVVTSRGAIYDNGFFESMDTGIIRIINVPSMGLDKIVEKALRLSAETGFSLDIKIQCLINT